jgi:hypothetical protein
MPTRSSSSYTRKWIDEQRHERLDTDDRDDDSAIRRSVSLSSRLSHSTWHFCLCVSVPTHNPHRCNRFPSTHLRSTPTHPSSRFQQSNIYINRQGEISFFTFGGKECYRGSWKTPEDVPKKSWAENGINSIHVVLVTVDSWSVHVHISGNALWMCSRRMNATNAHVVLYSRIFPREKESGTTKIGTRYIRPSATQWPHSPRYRPDK